eukprot:3784365-Prorocentrum_lima.AAC.1
MGSIVSTYAGSSRSFRDGHRNSAYFYHPQAIALSKQGTGMLFIAEGSYDCVRAINMANGRNYNWGIPQQRQQ